MYQETSTKKPKTPSPEPKTAAKDQQQKDQKDTAQSNLKASEDQTILPKIETTEQVDAESASGVPFFVEENGEQEEMEDLKEVGEKITNLMVEAANTKQTREFFEKLDAVHGEGGVEDGEEHLSHLADKIEIDEGGLLNDDTEFFKKIREEIGIEDIDGEKSDNEKSEYPSLEQVEKWIVANDMKSIGENLKAQKVWVLPMNMVEELVECQAHLNAIRDMIGLLVEGCRPFLAHKDELKTYFDPNQKMFLDVGKVIDEYSKAQMSKFRDKLTFGLGGKKKEVQKSVLEKAFSSLNFKLLQNIPFVHLIEVFESVGIDINDYRAFVQEIGLPEYLEKFYMDDLKEAAKNQQ